MNRLNRSLWALLCGGLIASAGIAQEREPAAADDPAPANGEAEAAPAGQADDDGSDELAAEDAIVDEILSEAELIYQDDEDNPDFIPTNDVSADQSVDYPVDI